jgi:hypothetical protein
MWYPQSRNPGLWSAGSSVLGSLGEQSQDLRKVGADLRSELRSSPVSFRPRYFNGVDDPLAGRRSALTGDQA